jgi:protein O-mannosyl-transferase
MKTFNHVLLIAAFGFLAYSNTFHIPFQWDDNPQIVENRLIKNIDNFISNTSGYDYNPRRFIGYLTFALNYYVGGGSVIGYHIVNLVIHLINAFLVFFLVLLTFKTPTMRQSAPATGPPSVLIALFSALLFVSHPVQTESVTYIVQRFASLATLFYLLSLFMYIKGRLANAEHEALVKPFSYRPATFYLGCLISAVLSMKIKEIAFTLPIMILFYEFTFFRSSPKKRLLLLLPVLLTLVIIPLSVLHSSKPLGRLLSDVTHLTRVQTSISRWDYLITEMRVIATYIRLIFFPINQNLDYDYPLYHSLLTLPVFLSFLFLVAIFGLGVYLILASASRRHSPPILAPYYRLIGFGILWFFVAVSVESSIIPIADVIAEHRVYLPSVGAFIAITSGIFLVIEKFRNATMRIFVVTMLVLLPVVFSVATLVRNSVWASQVSLWDDVVRKSPGIARGHNNLCTAYISKGLFGKAVEQCQTALNLKPDYAEAFNNLGSAYQSEGLQDLAIKQFQTAISLNRDYPDAHNNLCAAYESKGYLDKAIEHCQIALKLKPYFAEAHNNLAIAYQFKGFLDKAIEQYQLALRLKPYYEGAKINLESIQLRKDAIDMGEKNTKGLNRK